MNYGNIFESRWIGYVRFEQRQKDAVALHRVMLQMEKERIAPAKNVPQLLHF